MGGDDELAVLLREIVDSDKEGEKSRGGEGCFGFVENVESIGAEAVHDEREK